VFGSRHIAAQDIDRASLDLARAGGDAEKRGLADPVRPDNADHQSGREVESDPIERQRCAIAVRDVGKPCGRAAMPGQLTDFGCELSGHVAFGSRRR
jgi:hypothetical protein